ncbi:MAG: hypothetical protein O9284_12955 [Steroidobacteraceae bacterium]|nr:hypothetical protein [Steroidobacteraceae bacterium]
MARRQTGFLDALRVEAADHGIAVTVVDRMARAALANERRGA